MGSRARQSVYGGDSLDPRTHQIADGKRLKLNRRVRLQFCPLLPPRLRSTTKRRRACQRGRCSFPATIDTATPAGALERATERSFEKKKKEKCNHRCWRGSCKKSFKDGNAERASGSSLESRLVSLIVANSTKIIPNYHRRKLEVALYVGLRVSKVYLIFSFRFFWWGRKLCSSLARLPLGGLWAGL